MSPKHVINVDIFPWNIQDGDRVVWLCRNDSRWGLSFTVSDTRLIAGSDCWLLELQDTRGSVYVAMEDELHRPARLLRDDDYERCSKRYWANAAKVSHSRSEQPLRAEPPRAAADG